MHQMTLNHVTKLLMIFLLKILKSFVHKSAMALWRKFLVSACMFLLNFLHFLSIFLDIEYVVFPSFNFDSKLTARGIIDLVKALCTVSVEEIKLQKPRYLFFFIFALSSLYSI